MWKWVWVWAVENQISAVSERVPRLQPLPNFFIWVTFLSQYLLVIMTLGCRKNQHRRCQCYDRKNIDWFIDWLIESSFDDQSWELKKSMSNARWIQVDYNQWLHFLFVITTTKKHSTMKKGRFGQFISLCISAVMAENLGRIESVWRLRRRSGSYKSDYPNWSNNSRGGTGGGNRWCKNSPWSFPPDTNKLH